MHLFPGASLSAYIYTIYTKSKIKTKTNLKRQEEILE